MSISERVGSFPRELTTLSGYFFSPLEVSSLLKQMMEGHQRQILGTLTVEQVFRDRASFSAKVREHVVR